MRSFIASCSDYQTCRKKMGAYMNKKLDRAQLVLSSELGTIAHGALNFAFFDAVGLTPTCTADT